MTATATWSTHVSSRRTDRDTGGDELSDLHIARTLSTPPSRQHLECRGATAYRMLTIRELRTTPVKGRRPPQCGSETPLVTVPNRMPWPNDVAARVALKVLTYRRGHTTAGVQRPVLFCTCDAGTVTLADTPLPSRREALPRRALRHLSGRAFERTVSDEIDLLHRRAPVNPIPTSPTSLQETR